jgi:RecB family exonuclease
MIYVRCSSLPRIMRCNASAIEPQIKINPQSQPADLGTATHSLLASMLEGVTITDDIITETADENGVDETDLAQAYYAGVRLWDQYKGKIEVITIEKEYARYLGDGVTLTGTADMCGFIEGDPEKLIVWDWKTGRAEKSFSDQLLGYALFSTNGSLPVTIATAYTTLGVVSISQHTIDDIAAHKQAIIKAVTDPKPTYRPSESCCMYCPRSGECPAKKEMQRHAGEAMRAVVGLAESNMVAPVALASLYSQSRILKKTLDDYEKQLRQAIEDCKDGQIVCADGSTVSLEDGKRSTIYYAPEIIARYIGDEAIPATITKDAISEAIGAKHDKDGIKRQKGKAIKACLDELQDGGYVKETTFKKLKFEEGDK